MATVSLTDDDSRSRPLESDRLGPRIPVLMSVQHKLAGLIRGEDGP